MKIAVIDPSHQHLPYHSTSLVVDEQLHMLVWKYGAENVRRIVFRDWSNKQSVQFPTHAVLPVYEKFDYQTGFKINSEHQGLAGQISDAIVRAVQGFDLVICHDILHLGWNLPIANGVRNAARELPDVHWLHWTHSIPGERKDFHRLHERSKLVFPSNGSLVEVAEGYGLAPSQIAVIPHSCDWRMKFRTERAKQFYSENEGFRTAMYTMVFPVSLDRTEPKGLHHALGVMGGLKRNGHSVHFVLAGSHRAYTEAQQILKYVAKGTGLEDQDFSILIDTPNDALFDLMQASSLSVNASTHESHGLTMDEMALSGVYQVLNKDLIQASERYGACRPLLLPFGGIHGNQLVQRHHPNEMYDEMAKLIFNETMCLNPMWLMKQRVRIEQNWEKTCKRIEGAARALVEGR